MKELIALALVYAFIYIFFKRHQWASNRAHKIRMDALTAEQEKKDREKKSEK